MSPLAAQTHSAPAPVVQDVTSDILVPEVMKLIWWSVSDMANKQSPVLLPEHWKLPLLNGLRNVFSLFCIAKRPRVVAAGRRRKNPKPGELCHTAVCKLGCGSAVQRFR